MLAKEALDVLNGLVDGIFLEMRKRSDYRYAILHESRLWFSLFKTAEGFLNDGDVIGTIQERGVRPEDVRAQLQLGQSTMSRFAILASSGKVDARIFALYDKAVKTMIAGLENRLLQLKEEQKVNSSQPAFWSRAAAYTLLGLGALVTSGCVPGQRALGAEIAGNPTISQSQEKTEEEKLYAQARELEKTDKTAARDIYLKAIAIDMKKGSVEKILERELSNGTISLIKAPGTTYDKQDEPEWVTQYKAELNKSAKTPGVKGVLVMFYDGVIQKGLDFELRQAIIMKELRQRYGGEMRMIAVQALASPGNTFSWYRHAIRNTWGLPPIRGPPSFALYKTDGSLTLTDIQFQGPAGDVGIDSIVRNNDGYWIGPLIFGRDNPKKDRKIFKYKNEFKLQEVASR